MNWKEGSQEEEIYFKEMAKPAAPKGLQATQVISNRIAELRQIKGYGKKGAIF